MIAFYKFDLVQDQSVLKKRKEVSHVILGAQVEIHTRGAEGTAFTTFTFIVSI